MDEEEEKERKRKNLGDFQPLHDGERIKCTFGKGLVDGVVDLPVSPVFVDPVEPEEPAVLIVIGTGPFGVIDLFSFW